MMEKRESIIFGILSGAGTIMVAVLLAIMTMVIHSLGSYFLAIFFIVYLLIVLWVSVFVAKGLFKKVYLISAIAILLGIYFLMRALLMPVYSM